MTDFEIVESTPMEVETADDLLPSGTVVRARPFGWDGSLLIADPPIYPEGWGGVPDGADTITGTVDDDLTLALGSPAIDAGDSSLLPGGIVTDYAGNLRIAPFDVDQGALETQDMTDGN